MRLGAGGGGGRRVGVRSRLPGAWAAASAVGLGSLRLGGPEAGAFSPPLEVVPAGKPGSHLGGSEGLRAGAGTP